MSAEFDLIRHYCTQVTTLTVRGVGDDAALIAGIPSSGEAASHDGGAEALRLLLLSLYGHVTDVQH